MNTAKGKTQGVLRRISGTFVAGLLAALPLALTLAVLYWLIEYIHRLMGPQSALGNMLRSVGLKFATSELVAYLIGVVITLTLIYLLGLLVEAGMKNRMQTLVGNMMDRVPLVRSVYSTLKKLINMFDTREQADLKAMSTVMCYFGGKGGTAVRALMPSPERIHLHGQDYYGVLIPTAPVPFGGAILYVPVDWVETVDIAFDELLNVYMSMGATSADYLQEKTARQMEEVGTKSEP